jgi:glycosyltransferase involved in cell wall biosynthesis
MRILFQHLQAGKSGADSSFYKLLGAYCERFPGDRLTVICGAGSLLLGLGRLANCSIEIVGRRAPRKAYLVGLGDILVRKLNRRRAYDVFWSINFGLHTRAGLPQVLTVNNSYQVYPPEVAKFHPQSKLWVFLLRLFFRHSLRLSQAAIVQTPLMAAYLRKIDGCPETVVVLPKAVAAERGKSEAPLSERLARLLATATPGPTLLYIATGEPHKNHRVLGAMMELLRRKGSAAHLIVTLSAEEWRRAGGPEAGSLIESGHVIPAGWVDTDELGALYRECQVCVMPSLLESLSSAHLEAMYWHRPQVTADLPYARDLCGGAALYADPHEPIEWAEQVERLLVDEPLREELVARGAQRLAAFPPTWTAMAESVREVLAGAIDGNGKR